MSPRNRQQATAGRTDPAHARGRHGEELVAREYGRRGYRVVARRLRTQLAEIDLVVRSGRDYVAVEVKTRCHDLSPEQAVAEADTLRLARALLRLSPVLDPRPRRLRVDVASVRLTGNSVDELRLFSGEWFPAP